MSCPFSVFRLQQSWCARHQDRAHLRLLNLPPPLWTRRREIPRLADSPDNWRSKLRHYERGTVAHFAVLTKMDLRSIICPPLLPSASSVVWRSAATLESM